MRHTDPGDRKIRPVTTTSTQQVGHLVSRPGDLRRLLDVGSDDELLEVTNERSSAVEEEVVLLTSRRSE